LNTHHDFLNPSFCTEDGFFLLRTCLSSWMMLRGKKILVGVTGSIAAYKIPLLVRLLVKEGAEVRVILTRDAAGFVTPLTLSTVSKNPVHSEFSDPATGEWVNHVALGLWPTWWLSRLSQPIHWLRWRMALRQPADGRLSFRPLPDHGGPGHGS
jgi:hypothetical protein